MSTTVKSTFSSRAITVTGSAPGTGVTVLFNGKPDAIGDMRVIADRAEFIAAIETELDGTFISHADLPEAIETEQGAVKAGSSSYPKAMLKNLRPHLMDDVRESLTLARYLDANPPIDVAQVDALSQIIRQVDGNHDKGAGALAEALVKAGVTVKEAE